MHFGFRVDAERVGDAVDVVEIGNHLDCVQNVSIGEPVFAQGLEVLAPDRSGRARQQVGKFAQCLLARRKTSAAVIVFNMLGQFRIL